jgi:hypothetical protein
LQTFKLHGLYLNARLGGAAPEGRQAGSLPGTGEVNPEGRQVFNASLADLEFVIRVSFVNDFFLANYADSTRRAAAFGSAVANLDHLELSG